MMKEIKAPQRFQGVDRMRVWMLIVGFLASAAVAEAHVIVLPRESKTGAPETYTMRVPTESRFATTSIELEVPEGVTITAIEAMEGARSETKKNGDRIVAMTWTTEIKPGDFRQFKFTATNPKDGAQITWKAHQHFADGTTSEWTPATTLTAP